MQDDESHFTSSEPKKQNWIDKVGWAGFLAILLVWLAYGYVQAPLSPDAPFDRLNTLFSGLAFWGVIYAILLQKSELILQRRELELTRNEIRGQKEQLEAQNRTLKQQRFENTFFSLMDLFSSLVNSIEVSQPFAGTLNGHACFTLFYNEFQQAYVTEQREAPNKDLWELCNTAYIRFSNSRQIHVGHYFRTLYNIVKFVAVSDIEPKQLYINILRAQLSSSELTVLFYNCLSTFGNQKFKPFVEQFGFLENMILGDLTDPRHKDLYQQWAFKSQS